MVLIFLVSSVPSLRAPGPDIVLKDKIAHLVEYFILGVLLFKAAGWRVSHSRVATFAFLLAIAATAGALDEIYQSLIPGREMSLGDWAADVLGAALGIGMFTFSALGRRAGPVVDRL